MSICETHKIRKRPGTCKACKDELEFGNCIPVTPPLAASLLNIDEEREDIKEAIDTIEEPRVTKLESIKSNKFNEREYIQALVETEIKKSILQLKNEVSNLKNIKWEHMNIPLATFRVEMFPKLESDGWKFCSMVTDPKTMYFGNNEPFVLFQRVQRDGNQPIPKNFKRYLAND